MSTFDFICENKIITICRQVYGEELLKLAEALLAGGLRMMEITYDQADPDCVTRTSDTIRALNAEFKGEMLFGAGTVLTPEQVNAAAEAGAAYVISPNTDPAVIRRTKELGLVSVPGAMTPTEILWAHSLGADLVKVFPADYLGLRYIKDLRGPINHVALLATAGITEENWGAYLDAGYVGAGISSRLCDKKCIAEGNWAEITARARVFAEISRRKRN